MGIFASIYKTHHPVDRGRDQAWNGIPFPMRTRYSTLPGRANRANELQLLRPLIVNRIAAQVTNAIRLRAGLHV